ncbi:MAG: alpha/beta hydrolase [Planctomycetota bacterium]|nr:alpha/beta hydrolase [Planctomycetota bacterium]
MLAFLLVCGVLSQDGCAVMGRFSPLRPLERSLIYFPTKTSDQQNTELASHLEDAFFRSADGTQLHGIFIDHPKPIAVALFMHGNAGNVSHRVDSLRLLNERHGVAALVFDYRGYGKSEGKPDEEGILEDARAARAWLANRVGIAESEIVLMGRSLGGGVAVDLAAKDGARGLVLASTFTSLPAAGKAQLPWVPTSLLMTQRLDSLSKIADYTGPLLQSHGDADAVIPYELGKRLFAAANVPKQFVTIKGGGHNAPQSEEYRCALDRFLAGLP